MAIELATAYVQVVPSMKGVGKAIVAAFDGASETAGVAGGKKAGKGFANGLGMQGAIIGAASAVTSKAMNVIAGSIGSAVNRADQMNNFPKVMKNLGYSSEDAAASIKKISASLDGLPTTSSAMTGMVQQLAPLTSNLDEATNIALAFNNAMLAGGASTMEQENALAQLTQMMAAGKVDMQAWRSVQAAMPGQLNQVAEAMMGAGHNANDLYEAMKDGKYGFDEFNAAVVRLNGKGFGQYASFAQQAKDATQGIGTAMENVQNRVAKAVQKVVEAVGVEDIAGAINGFFSQFGRVGDAAANMVTGVKNWLGQAAQTAKPLVSIWQADFGRLGMYMQGLSANAQAFGKSLLAVITDGGGMQGFLVGLNNIISALVKMVTTATRNVSIFIGTLSDSGGVQSFLASLSELWKGITQLGQGLMDAVTGFIAVGDNGGAAASVGQLVGDAFNAAAPLVKTLASALQSVGNWASEHGELIRAAIIGIGTAFLGFKTAAAGITAINNGLNGVFSAATNIKNAAGAVTNAINGIGGVSGKITQLAASTNIAKNAQLAWTAVTQAGTAVARAFNAVLAANPIGVIITLVAAVVAALVWFFTQTETGRQAWSAFTSFLASAWQSAVSFVTGLGQNIASFFTQTIPNAIQSAVQWFQQLPERSGTALSNLITSIGEWAAGFAQSALQAGQQFVSNLVNFIAHLPETIAYWLAYAITFVIAWIVLMGQKAVEAGTQFLANVGTFLAQLPGNIWNWLVAAVTNTANWVSQMAGKAVEAGTQFLANVGTFLAQLPGRVSSFLGNVISNVAGFAGRMAQGALNAGRQFLDNIVNTLQSIPGRVMDIGGQIVQGLIDGITSSIGRVGDAILGGVNDAIGSVKSLLGIHSPSRLFRDEIGMMMGRGLAQGIDASARYVDASMSGMMGGLMSGVTDPLPAKRYATAMSNHNGMYAPASWAGRSRGDTNVDVTINAPGADPDVLYAMFGTKTKAMIDRWG